MFLIFDIAIPLLKMLPKPKDGENLHIQRCLLQHYLQIFGNHSVEKKLSKLGYIYSVEYKTLKG